MTHTRPKAVVLSGAGLSADSGLPTFRDSNGLWRQHDWRVLASPEGWASDPALVLEFYNERRTAAWQTQPNAAHRAIAELESAYDVTVITQNVDALHERAGSSRVLHVHGELAWARSTSRRPQRVQLDDAPIHLGDLGPDGTQLRPDIVWFGEAVRHMDEAVHHVAAADKVLVVGTSLTVYPAAALVDDARAQADKALVALDIDHVPRGYRYLQGPATQEVPALVRHWLAQAAGL